MHGTAARRGATFRLYDMPTRGFVGTFDARCDQLNYASAIQFGRFYVDVNAPPVPENFWFAYVITCGVMVQTSQTTTGDGTRPGRVRYVSGAWAERDCRAPSPSPASPWR